MRSVKQDRCVTNDILQSRFWQKSAVEPLLDGTVVESVNEKESKVLLTVRLTAVRVTERGFGQSGEAILERGEALIRCAIDRSEFPTKETLVGPLEEVRVEEISNLQPVEIEGRLSRKVRVSEDFAGSATQSLGQDNIQSSDRAVVMQPEEFMDSFSPENVRVQITIGSRGHGCHIEQDVGEVKLASMIDAIKKFRDS